MNPERRTTVVWNKSFAYNAYMYSFALFIKVCDGENFSSLKRTLSSTGMSVLISADGTFNQILTDWCGTKDSS